MSLKLKLSGRYTNGIKQKNMFKKIKRISLIRINYVH